MNYQCLLCKIYGSSEYRKRNYIFQEAIMLTTSFCQLNSGTDVSQFWNWIHSGLKECALAGLPWNGTSSQIVIAKLAVLCIGIPVIIFPTLPLSKLCRRNSVAFSYRIWELTLYQSMLISLFPLSERTLSTYSFQFQHLLFSDVH